jgi:hypothetical protein
MSPATSRVGSGGCPGPGWQTALKRPSRKVPVDHEQLLSGIPNRKKLATEPHFLAQSISSPARPSPCQRYFQNSSRATSRPRRTRAATRVGVIGVFFGGFGAWAARSPLNSATIAPGVVFVESNRKTVQHLEGGIIEQILVNEREQVRAGQILLKPDRGPPTTSGRSISSSARAREPPDRRAGRAGEFSPMN